MPRPMHAHRGLSQASRLEVAHLVMSSPGISLADLSAQTGLHPNTLRDHVRVLLEEGIIRSENEHRATRGRPRAVFFPVEAATENAAAQKRIDEAKQRGDLLRRITPQLTPSPVELDGDAVHQLDALYEHLDEVGLDPDVDEESLVVAIRPCEFHHLVESHRDALCRVHEGLVRDVLQRAGGPVQVDRLLPLVDEHRCELILRLRGENAGADDDETRSPVAIPTDVHDPSGCRHADDNAAAPAGTAARIV